MSLSIQRLTLFAILDSIEKDLRSVLTTELIPQFDLKALLTENEIDKTRIRYKKQINTEVIIEDEHVELIQYLDFYDTVQIINRNKDKISPTLGSYFKNISRDLEICIPIRNAVMHGRPLEVDYFGTVCSLAENLSKHTQFKWTYVSETLSEINNDASYVFGLNFAISDFSPSGAFHNLPIPDFDDTGFVGRESTLTKIGEAISGPFPVISLIGPGGVGKTALALKAAYELLENPDSAFEAIVWVSAKANTLTHKEITRIEDAIEDSIGIFTSIVDEFESNVPDQPDERVLELLATFKILLIIDNLETVLDERLRDFIRRTPIGSKILITSRIGVASGDLSIQIDPLTRPESRVYFRKLVQAYSVPHLKSLSNSVVDNYIDRLFANPLFLKWFVTAVKSGSMPEKLLSDQTDILRFCFENVVNHLDDNSKYICSVYLVVEGPHSLPMLAQLTELLPDDIESSLSRLITFNIITMVPLNELGDTTYQMGELPRAYLRKLQMVTSIIASNIGQRYRNVQHTIESVGHYQEEELYKFENFRIENKDQAVVASQLRAAFASIRQNNYDNAEIILAKLGALAPGYFEVERVKAFLKFEQGDYVSAREAYDLARELKPNYAPLWFWYGGFLLRAYNDLEGALEAFDSAQELLPHVEVQRERARVMLYMGRYDDAENILDQLLSDSPRLDRNHSKLIDLKIQCFYRNAEHQIIVGEFHKAIDLLLAAKKHSEDIPQKLYDKQMADKYNRMSGLVEKIRERYSGSHMEFTLNELKEWSSDYASKVVPSGRIGRIYTLTHLPETVIRSQTQGKENLFEGMKSKGVVVRIAENRRFGFIRTDEGGDLFFHQSSVPSASQCSFMGAGVLVELTVGENAQGYCAIDVRLRFEKEIDSLVNCGESVRAFVVGLREDRTYGFTIIPDFGEALIRKADFINPDDWTRLREGDEVDFFVSQNEKGYVGTRITYISS